MELKRRHDADQCGPDKPEEYQTSEEGADEKSQKKVSETQAVEVEEIRIE